MVPDYLVDFSQKIAPGINFKNYALVCELGNMDGRREVIGELLIIKITGARGCINSIFLYNTFRL